MRVELFREIGKLKEEEQRKQRDAERARPWYLPAPAPAHSTRRGLSRLSGGRQCSVVAVALVAVAFLAFSQYTSRNPSNIRLVAESDTPGPPMMVPTIPATIAAMPYTGDAADMAAGIPPESTRVGPIVMSPVVGRERHGLSYRLRGR